VTRARTDLPSEMGPLSRFGQIRAEHVHVCEIFQKSRHFGGLMFILVPNHVHVARRVDWASVLDHGPPLRRELHLTALLTQAAI